MTQSNVLLVTNELSRSGAPLMALRIVEGLRDEVVIRCVSNRGGPLESDFRRQGALTVLHGGPIVRHAPSLGLSETRPVIGGIQARFASRLVSLPFSGPPPDLVYLNSAATLPVVQRMPWVTRRHCPIILHAHETGALLDTYAALSGDAITTLPDHFIAVSSHAANSLVDKHGVDPSRITVIPPFVDQAWVESGLRSATPVTNDGAARPMVIGGVGNPTWTKGPETWLQTAAELSRRQQSDRYRFEWLGVGENLAGQQFREMVTKLGLGGVVTARPPVDDPLPVMAEWDALLVSSWEESASLAALEAMALGKVVACFRETGGTAELVDQAGVVLDEFSPGLMAEALARTLDSPAEAARLGTAARDRVVAEFTPQVLVPRVLSTIQETIKAGARGGHS